MGAYTVPVIVAALVLLTLLRVPIAFSILVAASTGIAVVSGPAALMGVLETAPLSAVSNYEFITVPLFLLMAEFVIISGVAEGIFAAAAAWVGRMRGGLAIATALAGAGFAAICHSSTAAAATLSSTSIPAMIRANYEPRLAYGVVAISGTLGMLIPAERRAGPDVRLDRGLRQHRAPVHRRRVPERGGGADHHPHDRGAGADQPARRATGEGAHVE